MSRSRTARTRNSCAAADSPVSSFGEAHSAHVAPSSEHWKIAAGLLLEKVKVALVTTVTGSGLVPIDVSGSGGGGGSTIAQTWVAGVGSSLSLRSMART